MFNIIKKAISNTATFKQLRAMQYAQTIDFSYEEFVECVNELLIEQGQNWPCRVARYGHLMSEEEVRASLTKKAGLLRHIPWVSRKIDAIAKECDGKPSQAFYAETTASENGDDFKDEVILYYNVFRDKWWSVNPEQLDWREAVRTILRHEYRHVAQIKELRRRGGAAYVHAAYQAHMRVGLFNYKKDPMEEDAYANQSFPPSEQSDLGTAVDKIISNF